RRLGGVVGWMVLWGVGACVLGSPSATAAAILAVAPVALGLAIRPIRMLWRPVSGGVGLLVSRRLRPGARAWYVRSQRVDLVLVTARHGARLAIATPDLDIDEV